MKQWFVLPIAIVAVVAGWFLRSITFNKSPITEAAHRRFDQHLRRIISTAESMPANRYGYAPADSDKYFLEVAEQVGEDAQDSCAQLLNLMIPFSGFLKALPRPEGRLSPDAFPKEFKNDAVSHLKRVMDICDRTFLLLNDSKLNEPVTVQGDQKATKAEVLMDMLGEVAKAENAMDMYLQLNRTALPNPK